MFATLLTQFATAKTAQWPVDFLEEEGVIRQAYVLELYVGKRSTT